MKDEDDPLFATIKLHGICVFFVFLILAFLFISLFLNAPYTLYMTNLMSF